MRTSQTKSGRAPDTVCTVSELMRGSAPTVDTSESVGTALRCMQRHGLRHALVVRRGRFKGLVCERDIRLALPSRYAALGEAQAVLATLRVDQVCIERPYAVGPDESAAAAIALMQQHRISALPVVTGTVPLGLVTLHDIARTWLQQHQGRQSVGRSVRARDPKEKAQWVT